jgi:AcrR family transcriptional regulator
MPDDPYSPRKAPKQARSRFLVDAIVSAAARILPARPLEELTTHEVADAAGVSIGSLYQYFPSKEAIVGALIERRAKSDVEHVRRVLEEGRDRPPRELIERTTAETVGLIRSARPLYRAMLPLVLRVRRHRFVRRHVAQIREQVRLELERRGEHVRKPDLDIPVFIAGHAIESCIHAALDERPELLDDPAFARELADMVARYLLRDSTD